ncbi:MAG: ATP-binding protein [Tannerellaceae bacterium]|jgi:hypothetical protein|nr:ATP-binding protein [Tannerellaceae bacterium]
MKGDSIKGLSFENFRIFKDESVFDFAPLTILTGANSSGKSTVIKGLKLFKTFEQDRNEDWTLHFEEGTHQLGDFEIILSDASGKQEIRVCYKIAHESSADPLGATALRVEYIFEPDDSNSMKNGRLKRSSVYSEAEAGPVLLYRAERTCSHCRYYLNKPYLLRHAPSPERLDEYFPAPEILKLIARIPLDAYEDFEKQLWTLILQTYPEWQERLSLADFLEGLDELDRLVATSPLRLEGESVSLDSLKRFIKEGASSADFPSFYEELISKVVAETSHYEPARQKQTLGMR